ncbi:hypothetical protein [Eubacterium ramulus]
MCGFENGNYFSRIFKNIIPPRLVNIEICIKI